MYIYRDKGNLTDCTEISKVNFRFCQLYENLIERQRDLA